MKKYLLLRLNVPSTGGVAIVVAVEVLAVGGGVGVLVLVKINGTLSTRQFTGGCGLGTTWILGLGLCGFALAPSRYCCCCCCCCCGLF